MMKRGVLFLGPFLVLFLVPSFLSADYLYPGSGVLQPLAIIEPVTPDGLFYSWTGEIDRCSPSNFGMSLDFLRNTDNSDDWDMIFSATGAFRSGEKLLFGITVPYIIRDPEFNESDLLDLRVFARMKLLEGTSGFDISGEFTAILPTADEGTPYLFTLDSPVTGLRLAFSGGVREMRMGANLGFQKYLQSETGQDSDLLYSVWVEKPLDGPWKLAVEYTGSKHTHSGDPGDDEISDAYLSVGVKRLQSEKVVLGLSAAGGIGGDTPADIRVKALATVRFGVAEKKVQRKRKSVRRKAPAAVAPRLIAIMIAEGITGKDTEKRITRALQQKGYATGRDPDPGVKSTGRNILYYMPGMLEQAISVSRTLSFGSHLKDLHIEEAKVPITGNWLLLVLGGEK